MNTDEVQRRALRLESALRDVQEAVRGWKGLDDQARAGALRRVAEASARALDPAADQSLGASRESRLQRVATLAGTARAALAELVAELTALRGQLDRRAPEAELRQMDDALHGLARVGSELERILGG